MPINWSTLPVPTAARPVQCEYKDLETGGYEYLLYSDEDNTSMAVGLPVMTLHSGERVTFVQSNIPIITVHSAAECMDLKVRVYPYYARWRNGTLYLMRPVSHAQFLIPHASLIKPTEKVISLRINQIVVSSSEYTPAEDRSVYVVCCPNYPINRQTLMAMFSGNAGMVEGIQRIGPFQFRMTFRSPFATGLVLGGRSSMYYARNDHIFQDGQVRVSIDPFVLAQTPAGPCDQQQQQLHISFDEAITGSDIYHFFNAISPVSSVYVHPPTPYVSERCKYPRWAVVVFHHRSAVNRILRGAKITTLYLQDREMRVRSNV